MRPSSASAVRRPAAPPSSTAPGRFLFSGSSGQRQSLRRPGSAPAARPNHRGRAQPSSASRYAQLLSGSSGVASSRPATAGSVRSSRGGSVRRARQIALTAWGHNASGQCGTGDHGEQLDVPRPVRGLDSGVVSELACASAHSLALTSTGEVYAWGECNARRLSLARALVRSAYS